MLYYTTVMIKEQPVPFRLRKIPRQHRRDGQVRRSRSRVAPLPRDARTRRPEVVVAKR